MKKLLSMLPMLMMACSEPLPPLPGNQKVRTKLLILDNNTGTYSPGKAILILTVDTIYRTGDTVLVGDYYHVLTD